MTDFAAGSSIADALPFGLDASINHLNEDRFLLDSATGNRKVFIYIHHYNIYIYIHIG